MAPGNYDLLIIKQGYRPLYKSIKITAGKNTLIQKDLKIIDIYFTVDPMMPDVKIVVIGKKGFAGRKGYTNNGGELTITDIPEGYYKYTTEITGFNWSTTPIMHGPVYVKAKETTYEIQVPII